ncbi:hypothetical protein K6025_00350 [Ehrlichia sp. JZT12]
MVMGIAFASVVVIVIRLMAKLMYSNEKVEEVSSKVGQSEKKKSKGNLKKEF